MTHRAERMERVSEVQAHGDRISWHDARDGGSRALHPSAPASWHSLEASVDFDLGDGDASARSLRMTRAGGEEVEFVRLDGEPAVRAAVDAFLTVAFEDGHWRVIHLHGSVPEPVEKNGR